MKTGRQGVALIKSFEDYKRFAYPDPASAMYRAAPRAGWGNRPALEILTELPESVGRMSGSRWTCGWGTTRGVTPEMEMTPPEADAALSADLVRFERAVLKATMGCDVTQNQFDALVSFAYNVGTAGMAGSSVIKAHRRVDYKAAARAFSLWNKAGGRVMAGLTRRRAAESALYLKPDATRRVAVVDHGQQEVIEDAPDVAETSATPDPERPMAALSINRAGVAAGAGTAAATVATVSDSVVAVKNNAGELREWLVPGLLVLVLVLIGYIVWQRVKQRREGWA